MPRVLFVHNGPTSFVRLDRELLRSGFSVTEHHARSRLDDPRAIFRQVRDHDLVFGWFASWHMFWPVLFCRVLRKPSVLVIGGYDIADMPEIGYGHQRGGLKKWVGRWLMKHASALVTNSCYSRWEAARNAAVPEHRVEVIHHGLPDPFGTLPDKAGREMVLTVGNVDRGNRLRKGLEPFVRAAAHLPDLPFVLAGRWVDRTVHELRRLASPNVRFTGWLSQPALLGLYREASVYVQASLHEGFGMSVAEAMLAGCIPLVTRAGALPEVVGEAGEYLADASPRAIHEGVRRALSASPTARRVARERILERFPLEKRRRALLAVVQGQLG